ncbi:hypothetical protein [Burkholderia contaminans]|uniref:hypothetical protein n=1 Tax=Burkholderia contaminans TaxID=488447 RepID=UPI0008F54F46|nr:hypothetical protein [Burkholderia contaminans]
MTGRFTEAHIISGVPKKGEVRLKPAEPFRKYGILETTRCNRGAMFGAMTVPDASRLMELEPGAARSSVLRPSRCSTMPR